MACLLWFRIDLRVADNPALRAACRSGPVIPAFIHAPEEEAPWAPGAASLWWLHQSLGALDVSLRKLGSRLIIRRGPTLEALRLLVKQTGATKVCWNRRYEPAVISRDRDVMDALRLDGLEVESFNGALLHEPGTILNQSGKPFQVFTPFWRKCLTHEKPSPPLPAPRNLPAPASWPKSLTLETLELEPKINWTGTLRATWRPGEIGAVKNLNRFLASALGTYDQQRNSPGVTGTSRLSPHLHFGELSPRQVWHGVLQKDKNGCNSRFLTEIGWREFARHLLFHFPETATEPLRPKFKNFPWRKDAKFLRAWQRGLTGYPIVDAGMRELWATGWMHNRVRMIVASFLVKDLLISWTEGAHWFWDTLVDADLAQNTLGWQWTAGCGADAAPFFRIFNPTTQAKKFDPSGEYVRRWCPKPGDSPPPIISHTIAREIALEKFNAIE